MSSDDLSAEVDAAGRRAMLDLNESALESAASAASEKSIATGSKSSRFISSSKHSSPVSSVHFCDLENQQSKDTIESTEDSFIPEWRKTKRKVAKRTFFIEAALKPISGNEVERAQKRRKNSVTDKPNRIATGRTPTKVTFRKHSISHLLPSNAGSTKPPSNQRASEKTGQNKSANSTAKVVKDDEKRRRSKRERHMPQKLGPAECIQDVFDRDVIFGRPNGGVALTGNRLLLSALVDAAAQIAEDSSFEIYNSAAARAIDEVKIAGGRFLEWQSLAFHILVKDTVVADRVCKVLQEITSMHNENRFDEEAVIKVLGQTTAPATTTDDASHKKSYRPFQNEALRQPNDSRAPTGGIEDVAAEGDDAGQVCSSDEKIDAVEIGSLIQVFWPLDQRYYTASVLDKDKNLAYLQYLDDGLTEWIDLTKNWFEISEDIASAHPGISSDDTNALSTTLPYSTGTDDGLSYMMDESFSYS